MSGKNVFILHNVINDLVDSAISLNTPLLKLNLFGRQTQNQKLIEYTKNEINGYGVSDEIPLYRKAIAKIFVTAQAGNYRHTAEIPLITLPKQVHDALRFVEVREGVTTVENMVAKGLSEEIAVIFPMELLYIFQESLRKLYSSDTPLHAVEAKQTANSNVMISVLSNVRSSLLAFVMEIAEQFGYDIEIDAFNENQTINNQTIINQMNTTIHNTGDGNVVNTGDNSNINASINISKGDIETLKSQIRKYNIEEEDIQELAGIVQNEEPNIENNTLGSKSNNWILKISSKAISGVGKIATGISSNILASLIRQYYGMGS